MEQWFYCYLIGKRNDDKTMTERCQNDDRTKIVEIEIKNQEKWNDDKTTTERLIIVAVVLVCRHLQRVQFHALIAWISQKSEIPVEGCRLCMHSRCKNALQVVLLLFSMLACDIRLHPPQFLHGGKSNFVPFCIVFLWFCVLKKENYQVSLSSEKPKWKIWKPHQKIYKKMAKKHENRPFSTKFSVKKHYVWPAQKVISNHSARSLHPDVTHYCYVLRRIIFIFIITSVSEKYSQKPTSFSLVF